MTTTFTVTGGDTAGPTLTSLTFPTSVYLGAGSKDITFSATATDRSGDGTFFVYFDKPLFNGFNNIIGDFDGVN